MSDLKPSDDTAPYSEAALRFVYEHLQAQLAVQARQRDSFGSKATALLASALIFANAMTVQMPREAPLDRWLSVCYALTWVLYLLTGVSLLVAAVAAIISLWPRSYRLDPKPRPFAEQYRTHPVPESLELMIGNLVRCYETNELTIRRIEAALRASFFCLTIGLVLFLAFLLVRWSVLPASGAGGG